MTDENTDTRGNGHWTLHHVLLSIVAAVAGIWFLKVSYYVTMPLVLALFLTALVQPILTAVMNRVSGVFGHILGVLASILAIVLLASALVGIVALSVVLIGDMGPEVTDRIESFWRSVQNTLFHNGIRIEERLSESGQLYSGLVNVGTMLLGKVWSSLFLLIVALFLAVLLLIELPQWRQKVDSTMNGSLRETVQESVGIIACQMRRYLLNRTIVSLISGASYGLLLWVLGIRYALLFGMLVFVMNYIPNVGSIIAWIPPAAMALIQHGWQWALLTLGLMMVVETFVAYLVDPKIEGKTLRISSLVVLAAILFWGWLWGLAGALLAVPITVSLITLCRHSDMFRPVAELLSSAPEDAAG
jgi:AI-2 transport protein TqsA